VIAIIAEAAGDAGIVVLGGRGALGG